MKPVERRKFLSQLTSAVGAVLLPLPISSLGAERGSGGKLSNRDREACWLEVSAPFVVEDSDLGIHSEIVLTADTFSGIKGYADDENFTEYEIYIYDLQGKPVGKNGGPIRLTASAMHTTTLSVRELCDNRDFIGGMKVRLRPRTPVPMHASDLFSSVFLRVSSRTSFDNVHANPDPLEWQRPDAFFYSMPFPPLKKYEVIYSLFNPYSDSSTGMLAIHDEYGRVLTEMPYELKPHSSLLFDLRQGVGITDIRGIFSSKPPGNQQRRKLLTTEGGTIAVTNNVNSVKSFGYVIIKNEESPRFSLDHPIHQSPYNPVNSKAPFDETGRLKAKNILYTPLLFRSQKIGGITLESRFHLSSGAPQEEYLWLNPLITSQSGEVAWQPTETTRLPSTIPVKQIERGVIKLGKAQSCILDCSQLAIPKDFSGGLSLAISPLSNHTLMKAEVLVPEWGAHAFTHFRPGLASARAYRKPKERGGLATDYITTGARLMRSAKSIHRNEIVCVLNIDDTGISGDPVLEIFSAAGLEASIKLGGIPGFGHRNYLLSELVSGSLGKGDLTLRLIDDEAILLMSVVHIDYVRQDIALDHGSDRFSTFREFDCTAAL